MSFRLRSPDPFASRTTVGYTYRTVCRIYGSGNSPEGNSNVSHAHKLARLRNLRRRRDRVWLGPANAAAARGSAASRQSLRTAVRLPSRNDLGAQSADAGQSAALVLRAPVRQRGSLAAGE